MNDKKSRTRRVRQEMKELTELCWQWDPIAVGDSRSLIRDEYDGVVAFVLSRLHAREEPEALRAALAVYFDEHFGVTEPPDSEGFVEKAIAWYQGFQWVP